MTIFALSTGPGIAGIAVIRVSGKDSADVVKKITGSKLPPPRVATLTKFHKNGSNRKNNLELSGSPIEFLLKNHVNIEFLQLLLTKAN